VPKDSRIELGEEDIRLLKKAADGFEPKLLEREWRRVGEIIAILPNSQLINAAQEALRRWNVAREFERRRKEDEKQARKNLARRGKEQERYEQERLEEKRRHEEHWRQMDEIARNPVPFRPILCDEGDDDWNDDCGRGQGNAGGWPSTTGNPSGGNRSNG